MTPVTTSRGACFRFFDLPAEVRSMVYDRLPNMITHHSIDCGPALGGTVTLVSVTAPTPILRTCKFFQKDAAFAMKKKLEQIKTELGGGDFPLPHIITDKWCLEMLLSRFAPLVVTLEWFCELQKNPSADFANFIRQHTTILDRTVEYSDVDVRSVKDFVRKSGYAMIRSINPVNVNITIRRPSEQRVYPRGSNYYIEYALQASRDYDVGVDVRYEKNQPLDKYSTMTAWWDYIGINHEWTEGNDMDRRKNGFSFRRINVDVVEWRKLWGEGAFI